MNQRAASRCAQVVAPVLAQGERIDMVEVVQIGKVSAKRQIATAAVAGIVSAGTVLVAVHPRPYYLLLTSQRLILIHNLRGTVGTIAAVAPRQAITAEPLRGHLLTLSMNVSIGGTPQRFSWGRLQTGMARRVAAALNAPAG